MSRSDVRHRLEREFGGADFNTIHHKTIINQQIDKHVWKSKIKCKNCQETNQGQIKRSQSLSDIANIDQNQYPIHQCMNRCFITPNHKRRKLDNHEFSAENADDEYCVLISKALDSSQLTQLYQIPSIINKSIAEYAMGHVKKCRLNLDDCNIDMLLLNYKWSYLDENEKRWKLNEHQIDSCFKCNEKVFKQLEDTLNCSDLTKLTRKDVRHRLQEIFGKEFTSLQWKQVIKCKIEEFVMKRG